MPRSDSCRRPVISFRWRRSICQIFAFKRPRRSTCSASGLAARAGIGDERGDAKDIAFLIRLLGLREAGPPRPKSLAEIAARAADAGAFEFELSDFLYEFALYGNEAMLTTARGPSKPERDGGRPRCLPGGVSYGPAWLLRAALDAPTGAHIA